MSYTSISVVPIVRNWSLTVKIDGLSGTRSYISADALPNENAVELPSLNDKWDASHELLVVTNISSTPIDGNPACGYYYDVTYGAQTDSSNNEEDVDFTPVTMSFAANYVSFSDTGFTASSGTAGSQAWSGKHWNLKEEDLANSKHWIWPDGTFCFNLQFTKREVLINLTMHKKLSLNSYDSFARISEDTVGYLNDGSFLGMPSLLALYLGSDTTESFGPTGERIYDIQMQFLISVKDGEFKYNNGHNKVYRPSIANWDEPLSDGLPIYTATSFDPLFNIQNEKPPPDIFPNLPIRT